MGSLDRLSYNPVYDIYSKQDITMRLRQVREGKHVTQMDLAVKLHMSQPYLSNLENGKANVSLYTLRRIAKALKVRVVDLIADE